MVLLNYVGDKARYSELTWRIFQKCNSMGITESEFHAAVDRFINTVSFPNWTQADFMKCVQKSEFIRYVPLWFEELPEGAEFQNKFGKKFVKVGEMAYFTDGKGVNYFIQPSRINV